jgi:hypothetical protein
MEASPLRFTNTQVDLPFEDYYLDTKLNIIRHGLILEHSDSQPFSYKDPSITFDPIAKIWHMYVTKGHNGWGDEKPCLKVGHFTAANIEGPWQEAEGIDLNNFSGPGVCAPAVDYQNGKFYMYIQQTWDKPGGHILWGTSEDGERFKFEGCAVTSVPDTSEAGVYDAAVRILKGTAYLIYSGFPFPYRDSSGMEYTGIHGDIYIARSMEGINYGGQWEKVKPILKHEDVPFHNDHTEPDREWGLEGGDIIELSDGSILLAGVAFLKKGQWGYRQRVFVAHAPSPEGPYRTLGILSHPSNDWGANENGHPCLVRHAGRIYVGIQVKKDKWNIGLVSLSEEELLNLVKNSKTPEHQEARTQSISLPTQVPSLGTL